MTNDLVTLAWAPGLIGMSISSCMYGVSLAQSAHYVRYFSNDLVSIKLLVLVVSIADILHVIGATESHWSKLVLCHRRDAATGSYLAVAMHYVITFAVQCFYCQRVWIITRNKGVTTTILLIVFMQLALGTCATIEILKHGTIKFVETTPLIPLAAAVSTICDIVITITVFKHLWRSELRGRSNVLRDLVVIFINMGALTWQPDLDGRWCGSTYRLFVYNVELGVDWSRQFLVQHDHYWIGAPAVIIPRCYVNSLLAVLNARRTIRERETRRLRYTLDIPTLPTIV
ncbi:hypothetical protein L210DRAFT_3643182 [Boletus edulis BED1]|uniref:DUF6534 domain-containing protein n=1 Tax=Boletus edulis BED1 TaxID=1328754 RepID=A0AAD4C183_BOLED|nr:hypothetical protein L210DRAFT_3643182 [Boletus edulis BED1]